MNAIHLPTLYARLGFRGTKIPKDHAQTYAQVSVAVADRPWYDQGSFDVRIEASRGKKHRVFARCPDCASWLPAGRLHQHRGTGTCKAVTAGRADARLVSMV